MSPDLMIRAAGQSHVEDLGRYGQGHLGLSVNGALDQRSARIANVLVGNPDSTPLIESSAFGAAFSASTDILFAVTGANADVTVDNHRVPRWQPVFARPNQVVAIRNIRDGLHVYFAVNGGVTAPNVLGSCSPDPFLGLSRRLRDGDVLRLNTACPVIDHPYTRHPVFRFRVTPTRAKAPWMIDATTGPDTNDFGRSAELLYRSVFHVQPQSNHVGSRLAGAMPTRSRSDEVLSRAAPLGAVEVPGPDELIVLNRGKGVTAGYPVVAVVTSTAMSRLSQARPGDQVRFRRVSVVEAVEAHRQDHQSLGVLRQQVAACFDALGVPHSLATV